MVEKKKINKVQARASLPAERRADFDQLVETVGKWSVYFYGTKLVSYAILAELIRDGWSPHGSH